MNRFGIKVAILNAFAYIYPVFMATYVDSHINHVVYGYRDYWMGYWVALGFIFTFIFTYIANSKSIDIIYQKIGYSASRRSLLTFLSLLIPIIIVLLINFRPELPHLAVLSHSFGYGLIIAMIVYVHTYIIKNANNLENLKAEHISWLVSSVALLVAFILFCLILYSLFPDLSKQYTNNPKEQVLLFNSFVLDLFMAIIFAIPAFIELFQRVRDIQGQIMNIKEIELENNYSFTTRMGYVVPLENGKNGIDKKFDEITDNLYDR
jgi:hypothetical protein